MGGFFSFNLRNYLSCEAMTKTEIYQGLKAKGIFDTNSGKDPLWQEAFKVYHQETRQKLSPSCGSCYTRLRNWLIK